MEKIYDLTSFFDLNSFLESLLIEFNYSATKQEIEVVTDFINWDLERGKREFKKIVFREVRKFQRLLGAGSNLEDTKLSYHTDNYQSTHIIQEIKIAEIEGYYSIVINLDNYFGGFTFECKSLTIASRVGKGIEIEKDNWIYSDVITNDLFEFSHPFPRIV